MQNPCQYISRWQQQIRHTLKTKFNIKLKLDTIWDTHVHILWKVKIHWFKVLPYKQFLFQIRCLSFWLLENKSAQMKMTQFCQIVEPSLKLIGRKFGNGRRLATGGGGFRPHFKFACTQFYAQHTHLILSSIFHWSSLNRHDQKFDSFSLQCRHTGRRRHKTRLQLRFCSHLRIIFLILIKRADIRLIALRARQWYSTARQEECLGLLSHGL